jgi:hypothetical protein
MKKRNTSSLLIIISLIILIIGILIFSTKAFLYIRALIGNDLIIKVAADKEFLSLKNKDSETIKFKVYAITNMFCTTSCSSKFIDLSKGAIIESDSFDLKLSKSKEYLITSPDLGTGTVLYRFDVSCNTKKTFFCETLEKPSKRTMLITMDYEPTEEELSLKNNLKIEIESKFTKINQISSVLEIQKQIIYKINETANMDDLLNDYYNIDNLTNINSLKKESILLYWNKEDYTSLSKELTDSNNEFNLMKTNYDSFNDSVYQNLSLYNDAIENIHSIKNDIKNFMINNLTNNSESLFKDLLKGYNNVSRIFLEKSDLNYKLSLSESLDYISYNVNNTINADLEKNLSRDIAINESVNDFNLTEINFPNANYTEFVLNEPRINCCLSNQCNICCDKSCNIKQYYPIILLHGHSFNEKISADLSLDTFEMIQRELDKDGYLNAGTIFYNPKEDVKGIWERINLPLTVKASYYFDIMDNQTNQIIIETKTDNLDTYTLRLKDIINAVKYRTGKDKVIIISHSMGGLIARRYLQIFGETDIDKLIMISSPNYGISGNTLKYCSVFGTKLECKDMDKDSLFINKLNSASPPNIPIYNIISTGCITDNEKGDGVLTEQTQYLSYAKNYYINGSCSEDFTYFHNEIINPEKYPEVYNKVREMLKG